MAGVSAVTTSPAPDSRAGAQYTRAQLAAALGISRQAVLALEADQVISPVTRREFNDTRPVTFDAAELRWAHVVMAVKAAGLRGEHVVAFAVSARQRVRNLPTSFIGWVSWDGTVADTLPAGSVGLWVESLQPVARLLVPVSSVDDAHE